MTNTQGLTSPNSDNRELTAVPFEIPGAAVRFASEALGETAGEHRDAMAHAAIAAAAPLIVAAELERAADWITPIGGDPEADDLQEMYDQGKAAAASILRKRAAELRKAGA